VYYRMEAYEKSAKIFESLLKNQKGNEKDTRITELKTNLLAAYSLGGFSAEGYKMAASDRDLLESRFEFSYNAACNAIDVGELSVAQHWLSLSYNLGKLILTEDSLKEQEIDDELSFIAAQKAFVLQLQGNTEQAINDYQSILKQKPSDNMVVAVVSNNIVVIKREHDLFDSFKKLRQATSQTMEQKLNSRQKKIIGFNRCLVLMHMNKVGYRIAMIADVYYFFGFLLDSNGQNDQCRELVKLLQEKFPESTRLALILAALLLKEKKFSQCEEFLKDFIRQHPSRCRRVQLSLAQLYLMKGNISETIKTLESIVSLRNQPGMVATLVVLYERARNIDSAMKTLDDYVSVLDLQQLKDDRILVQALKASALFKLKHRRFKEAACALERILQLRPNDLEILPSLIIAYSHFDLQLAEKYTTRLPVLSEADKEEPPIQAELLENVPLPRLGKSSQQMQQQQQQQQRSSSTGDIAKTSSKTKKRRKQKRIPKNFDPNRIPDPERWRPLRERSYYKKRGRKGKIEKSSQGASNSSSSLVFSISKPSLSSTNPSSTTTTTTPPSGGSIEKLSSSTLKNTKDNVQQIEQPQPQQQSQKKNQKKKKKKNKN